MTAEQKKGTPTRKPLKRFANPVNYLRWIWRAAKAWARTRSYQLATKCIPFILVCASLIVWWLAPKPNLNATYDRARALAVKQDDKNAARLYLSRQIQLNPKKPAYQYALALQHLEEKKTVAAIGILDNIASKDSSTVPGYAPADLLLASIALTPNNGLSLPGTRVITYLSNVLKAEPLNPEANRLMSIVHLENNQPALAEPYLARIAKKDPALILELAELQTKLGKPEAAQASAKNAERLVRGMIEAGERQSSNLIVWAKLLRMLGENSKAESVLVKNFKTEPDDFRQPLVDLYVSAARKRLSTSPFYRKQALGLLTKAFVVDPDSTEVAALLTNLAGKQEGLPKELATRLNEHWQKQAALPGASPATLSVGSQIARLQGNQKQAIRLLEQASELSPEYTDSLVAAYHLASRPKDVEPLLQKLEAGYRQQLQQDPTQLAPRIRLSRLLASVDQLEDAESVLRATPNAGRRIDAELVSVLRRKLSTDDMPTQTKQSLLHEALQLAPTDVSLLTQAADLAAENTELGTETRNFILSLGAKGELPIGLAYAALGTAHLDALNYEGAEKDLRESVRFEPRNPLAWNNLAIVLMRKPLPNTKLSIEAAKTSLRMLPDHETLLATYGEALLLTEQWSEATRVLQRAIKLGKSSPEIHTQLATAYKQLGNDEMAREHKLLAKPK